MSSSPSYASVAAKDAPPYAQQPHADQALLTTDPPTHDNIADGLGKVNIVSSDFRDHPESTFNAHDIPVDREPAHNHNHSHGHGHPHHENAAERARRYAHELEDEGFHLWTAAKHVLLRPAVAGGLLGIVNVGLLTYASYALYTQPRLRHDTRLLSSAAAGALLLFGAEGYAAERYRETPAGREEERRARKEGAVLYRHAREAVLRPGVLGGLLGFLNLAILGGVGCLAYQKWDLPRWDRRIVSAVSVGLLTLWSGEGYIAERHRTTHRH